MLDKSIYENKEICSACGGRCCKAAGCEIEPQDFVGEITKERILELLNTGVVCIEEFIYKYKYKDGYNEGFTLRMRGIKDKYKTTSHNLFMSNRCVLLNDNGCKLDFDNRPSGAKLLIPDKNQECYYPNYTPEIWKDYFKLLGEIYKELQISKDSIFEDKEYNIQDFKRILKNYKGG